jgi:lysophospholipase L1-like esterase
MRTLIGALISAFSGAPSTVAAWSPTALFAASEQGAWYDPSDFASMFQDDAGTIPVTATGQSVGKILDKSGKNNHAKQAAAGNRPVLQQDSAGAYYLDFSGTQHLVTASFAMGSAVVSLFTAFLRNAASASGGDNNPILSFGGTGVGAFVEGHYNNKVMHYRRGSGSFGAAETTTVTNLLSIETNVLNLAGTTHATEHQARFYGADVALGTTYGATDTGTGNFASFALNVGKFNSNYLAGRIYQVLIRAAASTAGEITSAESYIGSKTGVSSFAFSNSITPTQFSDSRALIDRTTHLETSVFAHADFTTTASLIRLSAYNTIRSTFGASTDLGVYIDGVYLGNASPAADGASTHTIVLPTGSKTVSITNGLQSKPVATLLGTFLKTIEANAPLTQTNLTPANRLVIYGDSIASGYQGSPLTGSAWVTKVRTASGSDSVAVEAWGYRSLYDDCANGTLRAAFVSLIAAYAPAKIWLAIGTNDYGLNKWSAASFGAAYAALLDDLHTALPSATIYCQTPILRTTETANGSGSTLGDYRTQIGTAQSTRSSYATLVDGTAFMTTASLTDGIHPSTAGHALYSNAVATALGL